MTAIALAESGGNSNAHNPSGEDSRGLWQINAAVHPELAGLDLYDPIDNARAAFEVSRRGQDISPWTVTHGGSSARYLKHRAEAEMAAVLNGDGPGLGVWTGTPGYGNPVSAGDPTGAGDFDPAAAGLTTDGLQAAPVEARTFDEQDLVDTDADGLIDALETELETDATAADSDLDGLSDSYEVTETATDPTNTDTDQDLIADSVELSTGTDPLDPDTNRDGRLDGAQDNLVDADNDQLTDALEEVLGLDTDSIDTDADGFADGIEHLTGFDPNDPANNPALSDPLDDTGDADLRSFANSDLFDADDDNAGDAPQFANASLPNNDLYEDDDG